MSGGGPNQIVLCLYCRAPLDSTTAWAHVVPDALGGRLKSRKICCSACNNAISPLEGSLAERMRVPNATLGALTGKGEAITIMLTEPEGEFELRAGLAVHQVSGVTYDPETKSHRSPLPAGRENQARAIARMLWQQGKTPAVIGTPEFQIEDDPNKLPTSLGRRQWEGKFNINTRDDRRVMVKMALELLAFRRPAEARHPALFSARWFARYGDQENIRFWADTNSAGAGHGVALPDVAHAVEVWTHRDHVLAQITFFGQAKFTASLTNKWTGPQFAILHGFDPLNPAKKFDAHTNADGPPLGVYHDGIKNESISGFQEHLTRVTDAVSAKAPTDIERDPGPDLATLLPVIQAEFAKIVQKKGTPKTPRTRRSGAP